MSSKEKQDILKMGNMLLEGWKMLSEGCPICATAIMSKNGNMRCPKCDLPIVLESSLDETQKIFTENPKQSVSCAHSPPAPDDSTASNSTFQSLEEAKKEYDRKNRPQQDSVSVLIGQYMLKGWTLLAVHCPTCESTPLMCQNKGPKYCVLCKEQVLDESEEKAQEKESSPAKEEKKEFLASRFDMSQIPMLDPDMSGRIMEPSEGHQLQQDQAQDMLNHNITLQKADTDFVDKWSQEISTKMLCGWVLLDEVCMRAAGGCSGDLPLLRDLEGEKYCVKCGYQKDPPNTPADEAKSDDYSEDFNDDVEDDDEDLDDEMAIKIQKMTRNAFTEQQSVAHVPTVAPTVDNASVPSDKATNRVSSPSQQPDDTQSENEDVSLKSNLYAHIDKKLKVAACRLDSDTASAAETLEWAVLITALAEARKAVKNM